MRTCVRVRVHERAAGMGSSLTAGWTLAAYPHQNETQFQVRSGEECLSHASFCQKSVCTDSAIYYGCQPRVERVLLPWGRSINRMNYFGLSAERPLWRFEQLQPVFFFFPFSLAVRLKL